MEDCGPHTGRPQEDKHSGHPKPALWQEVTDCLGKGIGRCLGVGATEGVLDKCRIISEQSTALAGRNDRRDQATTSVGGGLECLTGLG